MNRYRLSPLAERDIETILAWTHAQFGEKARLRYEALLIQGIQDCASHSRRQGRVARPEIAPEAMTYHLRFSRDRVDRRIGRVQRPRHFVLFRELPNQCVEISRVLHDSMELERHVPPDLLPPAAFEGEP